MCDGTGFHDVKPGLENVERGCGKSALFANAAAEWHIMTAGASIALIPILIVYLLANRQFITGLTAERSKDKAAAPVILNRIPAVCTSAGIFDGIVGGLLCAERCI